MAQYSLGLFFTEENTGFKEKLICSQEELHLAPRKIVKQTGSVDNQYGEW